MLKTLALSALLISSLVGPTLAQNGAGVTNSPPNGRGTGSELGVQSLNSLPAGAATATRPDAPGSDIGTVRVGPAVAAPAVTTPPAAPNRG